MSSRRSGLFAVMKTILLILLLIVVIGQYILHRMHLRIEDNLSRSLEYWRAIWEDEIPVSQIGEPGPNLAENGDFESPVASPWESVWATLGERVNVHTGCGVNQSKGLVLSVNEGTRRDSAYQVIHFESPPSALYVCGMTRTEDLVGTGARIVVEAQCDRERAFISSFLELYGTVGSFESEAVQTSDWTKVELACPIHPYTSRIIVRCVASGTSGMAYFDDIQISSASRVGRVARSDQVGDQ